jgi:hypothetical protein
MSERERPSGQPEWEAPSGRGVPAIPSPTREVPGARIDGRPVASWLGWAPSAWRQRS